jgi:protein SCO1
VNKKAFYGILIALIVPVGLFFFMDSLPKAAMPQPLFYDTVVTKIKNGKKVTDTVWRHIPDFTMTNQMGQKVSFSDVSLSDSGKITVASFFFTHCMTICPGMTYQMKQLQKTVTRGVKVGNNTADYVQFMSFSIDPERDSVPQLKKWADRFQVDPVNWWLLTGDKQTIYDLSLNYMGLGVMDPKIDSTFPHTDIFVLIDKYGVIRCRKDKHGNPKLYHSKDQQDMANLAEDIVLLSMEKDPREKSFFAGKLVIIAVSFLLAMIGVGLLLIILRKYKNAGTGTTKK